MTARFRVAVLSLLSAALGACSSGGGGGSSPPTFNFEAVAPNQTVALQGDSVTLSGTNDPNVVTSVDNGPIGTATVNLRYDGNRELAGISANTPHGSFSIDRNAGHTLTCSAGACEGDNGTAQIAAVDPLAIGWNYQTFGVWVEETNLTTFKLGAISVGSPTRSMPTTGEFTFSGIAVGTYIDSAGNAFATGATMEAGVNFGARSIGFRTLGTEKDGVLDNTNSLNLTGNWTYAPGSNSFSGEVRAGTGSGLNPGQASGRFYGPNAEEIGGVYSLQGMGKTRMIGGFGGKR